MEGCEPTPRPSASPTILATPPPRHCGCDAGEGTPDHPIVQLDGRLRRSRRRHARDRTDLTTDAFLFPTAFNLTGAAVSEPLDGTAFRLGGYLGYNWLFAPQWLVGLEGDGGWADNAVTLQGVFVPGVFASGLRGKSLSTKASWDGSIRGTLWLSGYAANSCLSDGRPCLAAI